MLGYNTGFLTFASLSQLLFDEYGYNTALLIMSSFQVLHIIGGLTYISPTTQDEQQQKSEGGDSSPDLTQKESSGGSGYDNEAMEPELEETKTMDEIKCSVDDSATSEQLEIPERQQTVHQGYLSQIRDLSKNARVCRLLSSRTCQVVN